jgi:hypothetical protein
VLQDLVLTMRRPRAEQWWNCGLDKRKSQCTFKAYKFARIGRPENPPKPNAKLKAAIAALPNE